MEEPPYEWLLYHYGEYSHCAPLSLPHVEYYLYTIIRTAIAERERLAVINEQIARNYEKRRNG